MSAPMTNDPSGRQKRANARFAAYMKFIANNPAYAGMPDLLGRSGEIQWETPSNRKSGQFKDSYQKRLEWWRRKAQSVGIDTNSAAWRSRVALEIHPIKEKPCKVCGEVLSLYYAYPAVAFVRRLAKIPYLPPDFSMQPTGKPEHIADLVKRLIDATGGMIFMDLPWLLSSKTTPEQAFPSDLDANEHKWLSWIRGTYVRLYSQVMSPGAMADPPDRLDGFHSYNLCCRSRSDTGRSVQNLGTYVTDRRVFEYWTAGDWVAADRLIGLVRTQLQQEPCANAHAGPCDADHIGPISLGFVHRPRFQLLCPRCNAAKNNRMTREDVATLIREEADGTPVISRHSKRVWDECKYLVHSREAAERMCRLLRDDRHSLMAVLQQFYNAGHLAFLSTLLELHYADYDVVFDNLVVRDHLTAYAEMRRKPRITQYATEQKARRCRIAFEALRDYFHKTNRNAFTVETPASREALKRSLSHLEHGKHLTASLDMAIAEAIESSAAEVDGRFRQLVPWMILNYPHFWLAMSELDRCMDEIGAVLVRMWDDSRYTR